MSRDWTSQQLRGKMATETQDSLDISVVDAMMETWISDREEDFESNQERNWHASQRVAPLQGAQKAGVASARFSLGELLNSSIDRHGEPGATRARDKDDGREAGLGQGQVGFDFGITAAFRSKTLGGWEGIGHDVGCATVSLEAANNRPEAGYCVSIRIRPGAKTNPCTSISRCPPAVKSPRAEPIV